MIEYISNLFPNKEINILDVLINAAIVEKFDFIKSFLTIENREILLKDLPLVIESFTSTEYLDPSSDPDKQIEMLKLLLETYLLFGTRSSFLKSVSNDFFKNIQNDDMRNYLKDKLFEI